MATAVIGVARAQYFVRDAELKLHCDSRPTPTQTSRTFQGFGAVDNAGGTMLLALHQRSCLLCFLDAAKTRQRSLNHGHGHGRVGASTLFHEVPRRGELDAQVKAGS